MVEEKPSDVAELVQGHRAESERLGALNLFLANFAPAIGETQNFEREIEPPVTVEAARNLAIVEAFHAVRRIAQNSFLPAPTTPNPDPNPRTRVH